MLIYEYFYFINQLQLQLFMSFVSIFVDPPRYKTGRIDHIEAANGATAIHDIPCYDAYMGRVWGTDMINKPANKLNIL